MPDEVNQAVDAILRHEEAYGTCDRLFLLNVLVDLAKGVREKCAVAVEESEGTVVGDDSASVELQAEVLRIAAARVRQVKS